jgi:hypothetical protein
MFAITIIVILAIHIKIMKEDNTELRKYIKYNELTKLYVDNTVTMLMYEMKNKKGGKDANDK